MDENSAIDENYLKLISCIDEATFDINGSVNDYSCRISASK